MASETSRSGGTADSYIGSLISLTSKSEIRYEGVLYNINTEESSIGLRNVRSFGTEGRKKDGPQIPPSDKVYEYILFRGSDIKDLEVKSSPLLQPVPQIHNDPAIIQSHFPRPTTSISNPTVDGPVADLNTHTAQTGLLRPTFQGNLPIYHPGGTLAPWGSSPPPNAVGTGIAGPMYWQGFYGPASGVPHLQQQLLPPPPTLSAPHPIHPQLQYRSMNPSLPSGIPTLMPEFPSQLPSVSGLNLASTTLSTSVIPPVQSPALDSETQASLLPGKGSSTSFPSETPAASLAPLASSDPEKNSIPASIVNKPRTIPGPSFPYQNTSQAGIPPVAPSVPVPTAVSSSLTEKRSPSLVTPDQLLAPGSSSISSSQLLQSGKQGTDIKIQTSVRSEPIPAEDEELLLSSEPLEPTPTEDKGPILLLPIPDNDKMNGAPSYNDQNNRWPARSRGRGKGVERGRGIERGGRGMERGRGRNRGRGYGISHSIVEFTEDFDFVSMNEKFKKDEVWGDLGRSKDQTSDRERNDVEDDTDCSVDEDNVDSKNKIKPVYVKDDFFDSLSCTALNNDNQNGRTRFSDQMKIDTETFGEFAKYRTNRGGRGYSRGGRSGSSYYYNRGYSNTGRGRGRGRNPL